MVKSSSWFSAFARWAANASGAPSNFALALLTIIVWTVTGPIFRYSDTWQLVIRDRPLENRIPMHELRPDLSVAFSDSDGLFDLEPCLDV